MQEVMDVMRKTPSLYAPLIKTFTTSIANSYKSGTIRPISSSEVYVTENRNVRSKSHMPKDSFVFETFIPAALVILGIITIGLILFAAGILLGIIQF